MIITDPNARDAYQLISRTFTPSYTAFGASGAARRIPFIITSSKRLIESGAVKGIPNRRISQIEKKYQLDKELIRLDDTGFITDITGVTGISAFNAAGYGLGSTLTGAMPFINMLVNPKAVQWSQPKRFTERKTMEGSVFFHFTNEDGQNNDILTLTFQGETGNINTNTQAAQSIVSKIMAAQNSNGISPDEAKDLALDNVTATGADLKLRMWHELYNITREQVLYRGMQNNFYITYQTVLMPIPITFIGFFSSNLQFTDDAANPYNKQYQFTFTVLDTSPKLDKLNQMLSSWLSTITGVASASVSTVAPFIGI